MRAVRLRAQAQTQLDVVGVIEDSRSAVPLTNSFANVVSMMNVSHCAINVLFVFGAAK